MRKFVYRFSYIINFVVYYEIMNTLIENWLEFWKKAADGRMLPTANDLTPSPRPLKDFIAIHQVNPVRQIFLGSSASMCSKNLRKHHILSKSTLDDLSIGFRKAVCGLEPVLTCATFSGPSYTLEMLQTPALTPNRQSLLVFTFLVTTRNSKNTRPGMITHTPV